VSFLGDGVFEEISNVRGYGGESVTRKGDLVALTNTEELRVLGGFNGLGHGRLRFPIIRISENQKMSSGEAPPTGLSEGI
jgi:hypothetical protein